MAGNTSSAVNNWFFYNFVLHIGIDQQRVGFAVDVFHHDLKSVENLASAYCTSFTKFSARFSLTIPSDAAKRPKYA